MPCSFGMLVNFFKVPFTQKVLFISTLRLAEIQAQVIFLPFLSLTESSDVPRLLFLSQDGKVGFQS